MTNFRGLITMLVKGEIKFILVGGFAATLHGSARSTLDLDIVYSRERLNMERLVTALAPYHPYLRGAPPGLPFRFDFATLRNGLNFTLTTGLGDLDLLAEIAGGGSYDALLPHARQVQVFGMKCLCVNLEQLIRLKRAAGRDKDISALAELEALYEELRAKALGKTIGPQTGSEESKTKNV